MSSDRDTVSIAPDSDFWIDVDQFRAAFAECAQHDHDRGDLCTRCRKPIAEAVDLYKIDFLAGFRTKGSLGFDAWQLA